MSMGLCASLPPGALGIPTRFLSFTMEEVATGNVSGHAIAES
ncbi:MAG: Transglutaminase domain protein [Methanoculleus marisnigri]|jgi:hypothetical protein|uniref:Transglutaminase domain protein n=1 Tax=Methanoculleus marisnigri TaxID=2198 RepID=A0A101IQ07_9EURY|nr:MAG: Transglutaminase domain protein [Methanoculleus marisnigri]